MDMYKNKNVNQENKTKEIEESIDKCLSEIRKKLILSSNDYIIDWFSLFITQPAGINKTNMKTMIEDKNKELTSRKINLTDEFYKNIIINLTILKEMVHNIYENYCNNPDNVQQFYLQLLPDQKKKLLEYFIYYKEILRIHENFVFRDKLAVLK
jgi:hypothetical protein